MVHLWKQHSELQLSLQHRKKKNLQNYFYLLNQISDFFFPFHRCPWYIFYNTKLLALHRGHPPVLVNQLHSFHVLISTCKSLPRGVKRLLCSKLSIWKMTQKFQLLKQYFFQEHGKQELFWKKWGTKKNT